MTLTCVQRERRGCLCVCLRVCAVRCAARKSGAGQQSDGFGSSLTAVKDETWFHMCWERAVHLSMETTLPPLLFSSFLLFLSFIAPLLLFLPFPTTLYSPGSLLTETRPKLGWWDECWAKSNTGLCVHTHMLRIRKKMLTQKKNNNQKIIYIYLYIYIWIFCLVYVIFPCTFLKITI